MIEAIEHAIAALKVDDFGEGVNIPFAAKRRIIQEYGEKICRVVRPVESTKVAVYIAPPYVWVCPSADGPDGVFFEDLGGESAKYSGVRFHKPDGYLSDYCSINAYLDGSHAYAEILSLAWGLTKVIADSKEVSDEVEVS